MSIDEALTVLTNVCASVSGNLKDHQIMQEALMVLRKFREPVVEEKTE